MIKKETSQTIAKDHTSLLGRLFFGTHRVLQHKISTLCWDFYMKGYRKGMATATKIHKENINSGGIYQAFKNQQ